MGFSSLTSKKAKPIGLSQNLKIILKPSKIMILFFPKLFKGFQKFEIILLEAFQKDYKIFRH